MNRNGCVLDNAVFKQYYKIFQDSYAKKIELDICLQNVAERVRWLSYSKNIDEIVKQLEPWNRGRIITFAAYCAYNRHFCPQSCWYQSFFRPFYWLYHVIKQNIIWIIQPEPLFY